MNASQAREISEAIEPLSLDSDVEKELEAMWSAVRKSAREGSRTAKISTSLLDMNLGLFSIFQGSYKKKPGFDRLIEQIEKQGFRTDYGICDHYGSWIKASW